MEVAFPEMEKRYIQANVKQMESYRRSRYPLPSYLLNRPCGVQGECLINQEKAKAIPTSMLQSTSEEGVFLISRHPTTSPDSGYTVNICQGHCSCAYFVAKKIPCKHMFAVFNLFPTWTWSHLPESLIQAPHMTLDEAITQPANDTERKKDVEITSENEYLPTDMHSEGEELSSSGLPKTDCQPLPEKHTQQIPIPTTTGNQLYTMQRKARDALAECISLVFCTTEITTLQAITTEAQAMKQVLLSQCSASKTPGDIPAIQLLSQSAVKQARDSTKQYSRTGVRLKRLQRSKRKMKPCKADPLMKTVQESTHCGRPRQKKEQRKKPPLPIRVSVETRIKQLRAATARRLGKYADYTHTCTCVVYLTILYHIFKLGNAFKNASKRKRNMTRW